MKEIETSGAEDVLFVPLSKVDVERREVYGVAAEERPDRAGESFDYSTSKPHFKAWSEEFAKATAGKSLGNLRVMHQPKAAGKIVDLQCDDARKVIAIRGKVVDDDEWKKVTEGVYTGFSIGGKYLKRWNDPSAPDLTRYTAKPAEISLVDNPCMYGARFDVLKADGAVEQREFLKRLAGPYAIDEDAGSGFVVTGPDVHGAWFEKREPAERAAARWAERLAKRQDALGELEKGSEVQTLLFAKDHFDAAAAQGWAKEHGFKSSKVDEDGPSFRIRQHAPEQYDTERSKQITDGVTAVFGIGKLEKAGEGRGNWGHAGRPGQRGGSAPAGEGGDGGEAQNKTHADRLRAAADAWRARGKGADKELRETYERDAEDLHSVANLIERGDHGEAGRSANRLDTLVRDQIPKSTYNRIMSAAEKESRVKKADDVNPDEGKHEYGDVTFADPENSKYPVDTEAHIRAAWSYVNVPKNAAKYADRGASVKRRIVAAWKNKIDEAGPAGAEKLGKGYFEVAQLAGIVGTLESLLDRLEIEQVEEGDDSPAVQLIEDTCRQLGDALVALTREENEEYVEDEDGEGPGGGPDAMKDDDVGKYGARHAAVDLARVNSIHKHAVELGADCAPGMAKGEEVDMTEEQLTKAVEDVLAKRDETLAKRAEEAAAKNESLTKALGDVVTPLKDALAKITTDTTAALEKLGTEAKAQHEEVTKTVTDLTARLEKIEKQPMPGKGLLPGARVLGKSKDTGTTPEDDGVSKLDKIAPGDMGQGDRREVFVDAIKDMHKSGGVPFTPGYAG